MMQPWFDDAKLGIFIHWGIYAVKGIPESWSFFNGRISYEDYMAQAEGFNAKAYDADAWAKLFRRAGRVPSAGRAFCVFIAGSSRSCAHDSGRICCGSTATGNANPLSVASRNYGNSCTSGRRM